MLLWLIISVQMLSDNCRSLVLYVALLLQAITECCNDQLNVLWGSIVALQPAFIVCRRTRGVSQKSMGTEVLLIVSKSMLPVGFCLWGIRLQKHVLHQSADRKTQSLTMMPTLHTLPAVGPSPPEISRLYLSMAFLITACQSTLSGTCSHQHPCSWPSSWLQAARPAPLRLGPGMCAESRIISA